MMHYYSKIWSVGLALALITACGGQDGTKNASSQGLNSQGTTASASSTGAANCGSGTPTADGNTLGNQNDVTGNGNVANSNGVDPNTVDASKFKYVFDAVISTKGQSVSANAWVAYVFTDDPNACSDGNLVMKAGTAYFFGDADSEHGHGGGSTYFATLAPVGNGQCALYTSDKTVGTIDIDAGGGVYTYSFAAGSQAPVSGSLSEPNLPSKDPNALQVQPCNIPTDAVGYNFFLLNPNDNLIDCPN